MKVRFEVTGPTAASLEQSAQNVLEAFAEGAVPLTLEIAATPLAHEFGEEPPALWTGDVEAEL